jgi:WD40 repeat protein
MAVCIVWLVLDECRAQKPELVVQTGHLYSVKPVVFSPDGKILATASNDSAIKLWDVASAKEIRTFKHILVEDLAFTPDGRILVSVNSGEDAEAKLWEVASGKELRSFKMEGGGFNSVAFSPDGQLLVCGGGMRTNSLAGMDGVIKVWDLASGKEVRTLKGPTDSVIKSVAFSADGKILGSGSSNGRMLGEGSNATIQLWEVASGRELQKLQGHSDSVSSIAFSSDGKRLVSGSFDHSIKVWDLSNGTELSTLKGHASLVACVAFSPDNKIVASGSEDETIRLWDVASGTELKTLKGNSGRVQSVAFSPDGKTLASGSYEMGAALKLWDVASGKHLRTFGVHATSVEYVAFSPNGKTLATGNFNQGIKLWQVVGATQLGTLKAQIASLIGPFFAFSPDSTKIAGGGENNTIKLWDVASGTELRSLQGHGDLLHIVLFSPDGKKLASLGYDKTIKLWDVGTGNELLTIKAHADDAKDIAFSPDSKILASAGGRDETIKLWDVASGKELRTLTGHSALVLAFSPDGKTLASGGFDQTNSDNYDQTIKLWDVASGTQLRTLKGHTDTITSVAFHPKGKILISGSWDHTIKLWDINSGTEVRTLMGHTFQVDSIALSPDGNTLASSSGDATIKLWSVGTGRELASLIALDENDWAVVTPEGRYDASPQGMELMHWVVGTEVIALSQLKERYYEPGLLAKLLGFSQERLRDINEFKEVKLHPDVEYEPPRPGATTISIKLTNRGGGIGQVQIFVNDKEFIQDARPAGFNPASKELTLNIDLATASKIAGKENVIRVVARNAEGYLASRGSEEVWEPPGNSSIPKPELYAIVAGISDYTGEQIDLTFPAKDAQDMAKALKLGAKRLFGAESVHIKLLSTKLRLAETNEENGSAIPPTKANFLQAFEEFKRAKPTDILIVYLAGHGVTLQQGSDTYLYLTQDARTTDKMALSDSALRQQTTISSDELTDWTKAIPALKQVIILDTCAAGAAATKLVDKRDISGDRMRAIERMKDRSGLHVLMGSAADAVSYEASKYSQGLLTYALLQGMRGAALLVDGQVDVSKLFNYAADQVPQMAGNLGGIQKPEIRVPAGGSSFAIGLLTEEEKRAIPLAIVKPLILRPRINLEELGDDTLGVINELRRLLRDETYVSVRGTGTQPRLVFVDEDELPGAIRPTGTYSITGEQVSIKVFLRRDGETIATLPPIVGPKQDVAALASRIMAVITEALKTLPPLKV